MQIYFSGSISGGREDLSWYREIVDALRGAGHTVIDGQVTNPDLHATGEDTPDRAIFERDLGWIADVAGGGGIIVAEVSKPSLGVGYEIAAARHRFGMPVVCLFRPTHAARCSAMIAGDAGIRLIRYTDESRKELLGSLLAEIEALANKTAAPAV